MERNSGIDLGGGVYGRRNDGPDWLY